MIYIVTYDISDNKQRLKVSAFLEGFGERVLESVFECKMQSKNISKLVKQLANLIDEDGSIRIYPLCSDCYDKAICIGKYTKTIASEGFGVF
ncbi:MAG: CRISPR-associated endonuclease Cas2 [Ignavibacteriaceae bacterium]